MKRYRIADLFVRMQVSGRTLRQAHPYLAPPGEEADVVLECDIPKIMALNPEIPTQDMAEYLGTGAVFARKLLEHDGSYLRFCGGAGREGVPLFRAQRHGKIHPHGKMVPPLWRYLPKRR